MKFFVASLFSLLVSVQGFAQSDSPVFRVDHYAIVVDDLQRAATFYKEVIGLPEITNKTQNPLIRWFAFADGRELHVIQRGKDGISVNKNVHLALAVEDLPAFQIRLKKLGVAYENWQGEPNTTNSRPDGILQIYVQDLDGYWLEINDAKR